MGTGVSSSAQALGSYVAPSQPRNSRQLGEHGYEPTEVQSHRLIQTLFLSERTAVVTAILALAVIPIALFFGLRAGMLNLAGAYDLLIRFVLIATLLHCIRTLHLDELIVFILLMCAELILFIDSQELVEG